MDYEKKIPPKYETICKQKIHAWFKKRGIKPFGNFKPSDSGFEVWGAKKEKGIETTNLYYVDEKNIAKWRGPRIGWRILFKEEVVPKPKKKRRTNPANKQMQEARMRARLTK